ncbi:Fic family protein [Actinokineospora sp. NPDC004072]
MPSAAGTYVPVVGELPGVPAEVVARGAFVPRPLPVPALGAATVVELAKAQEMLGRLDQDAKRLGGAGSSQPLVRSTQVREVQGSASLDGVQAALLEVLMARLPKARSGQEIPAQMSGYLRASEAGFAEVAAGAVVDARLMQRVAAQFAGAGVGGEEVWREDYAWLGGGPPSCAYLIAAPPGPQLQAAAAQFDEWSTAPDMLVVARAALGLYQWETTRPFKYGNGHIARLYVGLLLASSGVLSAQVLPLSTWIDRNVDDYARMIRAVVASGCYEPWIEFVAAGIQQLCDQELRLIRRLEQERDAMLRRLPAKDTGVIRRIVSGLVLTPVTNNAQIAELYEIGANYANDLCKRIAGYGLLKAVGSYAKSYYSPQLLRLMSLTDPVVH